MLIKKRNIKYKKNNKKNIKKNKLIIKKKINIKNKKKYFIKNKKKKNKIFFKKKIYKKLDIKNNKYYINKYKKIIKNKIFKNKNTKYIKYIRPPIITIMGHVNHGKTTLIKYLKNNKYLIKEKGNITQYIYSYYIKTKYGYITILDTPGHSIFTDMRLRSVNITDIIILIISIEDGIMPQTIEIINYIKKNKIPTIIAINKIDKINYKNNIEIIKKKLCKYNLIPKKWNGNTIFIKISTKYGIGIKKLIKYIFKLKKKINLNTNINNKISKGIVLDCSVNKKCGTIVKLIIKKGILNIGDTIICNNNYGKVKCIYNEEGKKIKLAKPSMPIIILGLSYKPKLGEKIISIKNNKIAKKIIKIKKKINNLKNIQKKNNYKNDIFIKNNINKINIIIKCDTLGSIETILKWIKKKINNKINIIKSSIGNINKNDLLLANTTKSIILTYNIQTKYLVKNKKINLKIKIYNFNLIYKLIKKLKTIVEKKNNNKNKNKYLGTAIIKNIFKLSNNNIAGCKIIKGNINKNNNIDIIRNNKIIYTGKIKSIKQFKKNINLVKKNMECGIQIKKFFNIKIGDIIKSIK